MLFFPELETELETLRFLDPLYLAVRAPRVGAVLVSPELEAVLFLFLPRRTS